MNPGLLAKNEIELLIHESEQLHDNIQRNMNDINKLVALAFPAITAAFGLLSSGQWLRMENEIYSLFCFLSSLIVVVFNGLWMQLLGFMRYKYGQVLPRLYELARRTGPNFGEFAIRPGMMRPMIGTIILQILLLPIAVVAIVETLGEENSTVFQYPALISFILALATTAVSWYVAWEAVSDVKRNAVRRGVLD